MAKNGNDPSGNRRARPRKRRGGEDTPPGGWYPVTGAENSSQFRFGRKRVFTVDWLASPPAVQTHEAAAGLTPAQRMEVAYHLQQMVGDKGLGWDHERCYAELFGGAGSSS